RIGAVWGRLGFGRGSGRGLPGGSPGRPPSRSWKQEKLGKPWQHGDTFNLGIGQGYMNSTPLQLAIMTARIANGGYEVQPNLLLASATPREELAPPAPRAKAMAPSMRFNPQNLALVREGMIQVVQAGTASHLRVDAKGKPIEPQFRFAGKTGTAQVNPITHRDPDM